MIEPPWTDEQVRNLNAYQASGRFHPFTCGNRDTGHEPNDVLVADNLGWGCPKCSYRQTWAHEFMALEPPQ